MKAKANRLFLVLGFGLALLLAACGGQMGSSGGGGGGGSGGGGGDGSGGSGPGNTVTVRQQGSGSSIVYYRVGTMSWQPLTLSGGQGTFTASGEYEVAARCDDSGTLYLFKSSTHYRQGVTFPCGSLNPPSTRNVEFIVNLPSAVGGVNLQSGDILYLSLPFSVEYTGTNPVKLYTVNGLQEGTGDAVLTLHRPSPTRSFLAPYGYKIVRLGASDTSVTVSDTGWQAVTTTKNLSFSVPAGFQGGAFVAHIKDGYLAAPVVGIAMVDAGRYGIIASGGVYVGVYQAYDSADFRRAQLLMYQDTGGTDWSAAPPAPWASGQFSVEGSRLTFTRTDAKAFSVSLWGLARRTDGSPLDLQVFVQAEEGGSTAYQIPVVPDLGYELLEEPWSVDFHLQAVVRDQGLDLLDTPGLPTEAQVRGINVVLVSRSGSYQGRSYTLP